MMARLHPNLDRVLRAALLTLAVLAFPVAIAGTAAAQESHGEPGAAPPHGPDATNEPGVPQSLEGTDVDAEEHGGGTNAEGGHGAGLPQLDAHTYPSQIFWLILSFGALYYLLTRKALPRLSEILEARQERIASDLDRAATLRAEAEAAMQRYQQVVAEAQEKAAAELKAVEDQLTAEAARRQAALEADLAGQLAAAEARIRSAKDTALGEIQSVAAEVAQSAVRRLGGLEVAESDVKAALDQVLREAA